MAKAKEKSNKQAKVSSKELRALGIDELKNKSLDLHKEQFNLRMQLETNQLQNTSEIRRIRRNIAQVKTILNEKTMNHTKEVS